MYIIYEFEGRLYKTNYLSPLDDMIERGLNNKSMEKGSRLRNQRLLFFFMEGSK